MTARTMANRIDFFVMVFGLIDLNHFLGTEMKESKQVGLTIF
jgi:hypothetical protein